MGSGILVVDDDPSVLHLMHRILREYPMVRFATSGPEALRLARESVPDLVLLDAEMPQMSGFEVCEQIKADPGLRDVPVVFVTAHDDLAFETRALSLGASDFLTKPLSAPRVRLRVQLHLELKRQVDLLRSMAERDVLTGLLNRRGLDAALEREWGAARRSGEPLSVLMADVDAFKGYNDTYGHPAGDEALAAVGRVLASVARRPRDVATRFGGEEFLVVLPATPREGARQVGQEICDAVAALGIEHRASRVAPHLTISIGVVTTIGEVGEIPDLIEAADRALYRAKEAGRNRVVLGEA